MPSYDIVGSKEKSVAIIEIRDGGKDAETVAEAIMTKNKSVKSVIKKVSERGGSYRIRNYELVKGDSNTEVVHKEHGYVLKLDPRKVYFSVRESTERQRIADWINPGEFVMVMFAGVGPYAIAIAKSQPEVEKVIAIEINPDAVRYMEENVRINKLSHKIVPVLGDVKEKSSTWYGKCDHVVMPLPLNSADFLDVAVKCVKTGGIVHFYSKGNEEGGDPFSVPRTLVEQRMNELNVNYEILDERIVLPYAPGRYKVCIEFKVL